MLLISEEPLFLNETYVGNLRVYTVRNLPLQYTVEVEV